MGWGWRAQEEGSAGLANAFALREAPPQHLLRYHHTRLPPGLNVYFVFEAKFPKLGGHKQNEKRVK